MNSPNTVPAKIGIVTNRFESTYYGQMVESASNYLMAEGMQALVQSNLSSESGERNAISSMADCDGLIIHADKLNDAELKELMFKHPCSVLLNRKLEKFSQRCVYVDNVLGGEIAANFLMSQGHRHIAMVRGPLSFIEANDRAAGFTRALKNKKLQLIAVRDGNFHQRGGERALRELHADYPDVTAVFFQNDEMAFGALKACRSLSIKVPEDLSIIGFDGLPMCNYVSPRLTSVQQPLIQIGEHAARMVVDLVRNEKNHTRQVELAYFSPVLAERESVTVPKGHITEKIALTQRETDCLFWTANGKTSWEISVILGVSESTATFHLRNAGNKLQSSNRAHSVAKAIHLGLVKLQDS